ncbi:disulfide isomerase [Rhizodiscina lignyota]|uniref:protein disulfide-isomerase n=1 Tax=Rhizodiscina lignyota TaxID=1504668 RepID=A0A9P4IV21_9PEZI|nr:disulfide isomerase [Rhizodiscina lignyota]
MARLSYLLVSALSVLGAAAASAVKDLDGSNFDSIVLNSGKPALVEFFAPWCGHCKNLAPVYDELASTFAFAENKVTVAKVDADNHKDLGKRFGVQGFPTLKWFDGKSDKPEDYSSGRDLESLQSFITDKTGIKPKGAKKAPSKVEMLSDSKFKQQVGSDKNVLVAFTAPWCGHCKNLAPTWETLAEDFASEPSVVIAKVDAESPDAKQTAQDQGVSSYPTIKYFPAGSTEAEKYEGGRTEKDFIAFINEKAGTHRAVGGGLDATGGTIAAMDTVVDKILASGEDFASGVEDVKKAAKSASADASNKFADYYVKVTEKMGTNKGYVEKELKRLQGLLAKGGLAPEKQDDLTSRSNILRKFIAAKDEAADAVKEEL